MALSEETYFKLRILKCIEDNLKHWLEHKYFEKKLKWNATFRLALVVLYFGPVSLRKSSMKTKSWNKTNLEYHGC